MKLIDCMGLFVTVNLVTVGCNVSERPYSGKAADRAELTVELASASVEILNHRVVASPTPTATFAMRVTNSVGVAVQRNLSLFRSSDSLRTGLGMALSGEDGELLVEVIQRWGLAPDGAALYYMRESTPTDVLELNAETRGRWVREMYTLNGAPFAADYERDTPEMLLAREDFRRFYSAGNVLRKITLDENADGRMMLALTTNEAFLHWATDLIKESFANPAQMAQVACDAECICGIAGLCGFFKCTFGGGMLNFMCDACVGAGLACSIAALF